MTRAHARLRSFFGRSGRTLPVSGFRRIVVVVGDYRESAEAADVACRLSRQRGAKVTFVAVVEVPNELPFDCQMDREESHARGLLERARGTSDSYGVKSVVRLLRARGAAAAIVEEIERQKAELAVVGAAWDRGLRTARLGRTVETVLRRAPCRVLLVSAGRETANRAEAAPVSQRRGVA